MQHKDDYFNASVYRDVTFSLSNYGQSHPHFIS